MHLVIPLLLKSLNIAKKQFCFSTLFFSDGKWYKESEVDRLKQNYKIKLN